MRRIKIDQLIDDNQLEVVAGANSTHRYLTEMLISRPGIELAGYTTFFDKKRLILIGSKENSFFELFDPVVQEVRLRELLKEKPPAIIFSKNVEVPEIYKQLGEEYGIPILKSYLGTTATNSKLFSYLQDHLSPRKSIHGTLMDINGLGTLIIGKSGVGKSEVSLELIKMGHILIGDDRIDIFQKDVGIIIGQAPQILSRYLEIRGIGIVDVVSMFGVGAYRENKKIRLVVELEKWESNKNYDRLGLVSNTIKYFDTEIPKVTIPIKPGRNVALLVESAAANQKLKYLGYHAAFNLTREIRRSIDKNERESKE